MSNPKPRVLAIDNRPANLLTLKATLAPEFVLQFASSGAQGLAMAIECPPDLILIDVMMSEMDGYETCRRIKADPRLQDIPVIFVTASGSMIQQHPLQL
jgi:CheY-like chemotaxis protein